MSVNSKMTAIANAIRSLKSIVGRTLTLDDMASEISAIGKYTGTQASGTKAITSNGTHDVTEYASVSVAVPELHGYKEWTIHVVNRFSGGKFVFVTDPLIAAHYNSDAAQARLKWLGDVSELEYHDYYSAIIGNEELLYNSEEKYGFLYYRSSSALAAEWTHHKLSDASQTAQIQANSSGEIYFTATGSRSLRPGDYRLVFRW